MNLNTLPLALLAVLCASLSTSYAVKMVKELDNELMNLDCPPGKKAAKVGQFCPKGARDPRGCRPTRVECVPQSFGNNQVQLVTVSKNPGTTPAPKTEEELDYEMQHMQCPFGEKPMKTAPFCPIGAKHPRDCSLVTVTCVKLSFSNYWRDRTVQKVSTLPMRPQQMDDELDRKMAHMACSFGWRPAKVAICPSGSRDAASCWRVVVKCVRSHFGNTWEGTEPITLKSTSSPKTEELDREMMHAECPSGQRPAKVSPLCPTGAKRTLDCPPVEVACVQQTFGNNPGSTKSPGRGPTVGSWPKTEEELDYEMTHKKCIFWQRPAKISPWCPKGAKDTLDCAHTEVWCVKESFGNDPGYMDFQSSTSTTPLVTTDQLEKEMARMICPLNHQPSLIKGICPTGSVHSTSCTQANANPIINIVDKIMRGHGSEPKWSEGDFNINMIFPSRTSKTSKAKFRETNAKPN